MLEKLREMKEKIQKQEYNRLFRIFLVRDVKLNKRTIWKSMKKYV